MDKQQVKAIPDETCGAVCPSCVDHGMSLMDAAFSSTVEIQHALIASVRMGKTMKNEEVEALAESHGMDSDSFAAFGRLFNNMLKNEIGTLGQSQMSELVKRLVMSKRATPSTFSPELIALYNGVLRKAERPSPERSRAAREGAPPPTVTKNIAAAIEVIGSALGRKPGAAAGPSGTQQGLTPRGPSKIVIRLSSELDSSATVVVSTTSGASSRISRAT